MEATDDVSSKEKGDVWRMDGEIEESIESIVLAAGGLGAIRVEEADKEGDGIA